MVTTGAYRICFSFDVGTNKTRSYTNKPVRLSNARDLVRAANRKGLWTYATFLIGFPDESEEDILETIRFSRSLRLDYVKFYIVQAYYGTKFFHDLVARGLSREGTSSPYPTAHWTDTASRKRLLELRDCGEYGYFWSHIRDFLSPKYVICEFLPKLRSFSRIKYFLRLVGFLASRKSSRSDG